MIVNINGEFFEKDHAKISVYDHGFLYGDGVFEGLRVYNGQIFQLAKHLIRLYESANALLINVPISPDDMEQRMLKCVKRYLTKDGYIRLIVTRGVGPLGIDPNKCQQSNIIIILDNIALYPKELYKSGITIITASVRRNRPDMMNPQIKSMNYINNILAKIEAQNAGCLEALILNEKGFVAECTADNIFIVKYNEIFTPDVHEGALEGITRQVIIDCAINLGYKVHESQLSQFDLFTAHEVFMTGTACEIMPIIKIDGRIIGTGKPGPVFQRLLLEFQSLINNL